MLKQVSPSPSSVTRRKVVSAFGALSVLITGTFMVAANPVAMASLPIAAQTKTPVKSAPALKKPVAEKAEDKKGDKDATAKDKQASAREVDASIASAAKVDPLALLQKPEQYLNKKVTFTATFNRFADIALDYKKAFRDSRDYVTFFILRPDVSEHTIPLSEMKLFFPRKKSDEVMDLEAGDKIQIVATQFSTALDEPWLDVEHIKILEKTTKPERKHNTDF